MTITLSDGSLSLTIVPERGGEARSLALGDVEFLYRSPWASAPLPPGPLDEVPWERSWHGGWQLLWPNAGSACTVDGVEHGFHGAGSVARFRRQRAQPAARELCAASSTGCAASAASRCATGRCGRPRG